MSVEFTTAKMNGWHESRGSNQKFWSGSEFWLKANLLTAFFGNLSAPKSGLDIFRLESSSIVNLNTLALIHVLGQLLLL